MPTPRRRRNPQHPQVFTPAFKRWFGKSKIVDADGNPQRLYHMTTGNFDVFKPGGDDPRISGRAIWLTPYPENIPAAHSVMDYVKGEGLVYRAGANIMPLWARIENPLYILDADDAQYAEQFRLDSFGFPTTLSDKTIAAIKKAGYDGIVFGQWRSHEGYDLTTGRGVEVIVFDPTQVKSATGNRGTFDPDDPSIVRNPRRRGLDVRPGIPGTYRTEFTAKSGRKRAYPAQGGAAWDDTLVRVANETTVASGRVYDTVKRAERAGRATVRGKRGAVEVLRVTNPRRCNPDTERAAPRRRKNGALAPLVVGGVALAAGAVAFHGLRGSGGGSVAGWKRERLPASLGKGYRYTRTLGGAVYTIEENTQRDRIDLYAAERGGRLEPLHPPGTDYGSWSSVEDAAQYAQRDAAWRAANPVAAATEDTAAWKRVKTKEGDKRGEGEFEHQRTINGFQYVIRVDKYDRYKHITLEGGPRGERISPPGTDYGTWNTLDEAKAAAEDDARRYAGRRKNGFLGAVGLLGLGFAGGAYLENERPFVAKAKDRLRGPTKVAREQAARLQREVFTPAPAKRASAPAPAKRTATTDPAWRRERSPDGKGYAHLRTINGVAYEVWERIYSDGGKAIFLEAGDKRDRIYAPNGEEDGWVSVAAAKKAAEADAKTRKNPRRRK